MAQRLRNHRDFVYKFDDIDTDMLIITAIGFEPEEERLNSLDCSKNGQ